MTRGVFDPSTREEVMPDGTRRPVRFPGLTPHEREERARLAAEADERFARTWAAMILRGRKIGNRGGFRGDS